MLPLQFAMVVPVRVRAVSRAVPPTCRSAAMASFFAMICWLRSSRRSIACSCLFTPPSEHGAAATAASCATASIFPISTATDSMSPWSRTSFGGKFFPALPATPFCMDSSLLAQLSSSSRVNALIAPTLSSYTRSTVKPGIRRPRLRVAIEGAV
eukprot:SAG11_NODE_15037_length_591_cov_0.802846_1_plen_153_part_10